MTALMNVQVPNVREDRGVTGEFGAIEDDEEGYATAGFREVGTVSDDLVLEEVVEVDDAGPR